MNDWPNLVVLVFPLSSLFVGCLLRKAGSHEHLKISDMKSTTLSWPSPFKLDAAPPLGCCAKTSPRRLPHAYRSPTQSKKSTLSPCVSCASRLSCQGRRILDSGLGVTWGDGQHWVQVNEPTSPRGSVWHLNNVCWLSVHATVPAPPPGCYAGFFRVRQPIQGEPLIQFSAEWKVAATMAVSAGRYYSLVVKILQDQSTRNCCRDSRKADCGSRFACPQDVPPLWSALSWWGWRVHDIASTGSCPALARRGGQMLCEGRFDFSSKSKFPHRGQTQHILFRWRGGVHPRQKM